MTKSGNGSTCKVRFVPSITLYLSFTAAMVLGILDAAISSAYFPKNYVPHIVTAAASLVLIRAFSQGRTTSRDRDLHARTILVTVHYVLFE